MTITDGEKTMTLEELARKMCRSMFAANEETCWDGSCPAADYCTKNHNGMIDWLRDVIGSKARRSVYARAILQYGKEAQQIVALEELSETQKEICKLQRGSGSVEHLAEEIADATIMLEQLRMIYGIDARVCEYIEKKTQRLADRLKGGE